MVEVLPDGCASFVREGEALLCFSAPWSQPGKALEAVLAEIAGQVPTLRIGRVDIDRDPELVSRFRLTACPTFELFVNGVAKARMVGATSGALLLERLREAGIEGTFTPRPLLPLSSAVLRAAAARAEQSELLEEKPTLAMLVDELSAPATAYTRLSGRMARQMTEPFAPAYYAVMRELGLLTRFLVRETRSEGLGVRQRAGLALALQWLTSSRQHEPQPGPCGGFLLEWLVIHAARLQFHERPSARELRHSMTLSAFVAAGLPTETVKLACEVAMGLAHLAEALAGETDDTARRLLEDLLASEPQRPWAPPVMAVAGDAEAQPAAHLARAWLRTAVGLGYRDAMSVWLRFSDSTSVSVVGHAVHVLA